jgi:ankyrin repeat protein
MRSPNMQGRLYYSLAFACLLLSCLASQTVQGKDCPINFPAERSPRAPEGPIVKALREEYTRASAEAVASRDRKELAHDAPVEARVLEVAMQTKVLSKEDCAAPYYAAMFGYEKVLDRLLDLGSDTYAAEGWLGMTPLTAASYYGRLTTVRVLIERKAARVDEAAPMRIDIMSGHGFALPALSGGETALLWASRQGHEDVVRYLLQHGASVNYSAYGGMTAMRMAKAGLHDNIVRLLEASGAHN